MEFLDQKLVVPDQGHNHTWFYLHSLGLNTTYFFAVAARSVNRDRLRSCRGLLTRCLVMPSVRGPFLVILKPDIGARRSIRDSGLKADLRRCSEAN